MAKKGRPSEAERDYIRQNAKRMTAKEMAAALDRSEDFVDGVLGEDKSNSLAQDILGDFRRRNDYENLKKQFNKEELDYFEHEYVKWVTQFRYDIQPTEDTQIFMALSYKILINRTLREQKEVEEGIDMLRQEIDAARDRTDYKTKDDKKEAIAKLNDRLGDLRFALTKLSARLDGYMKTFQQQMSALKGNRDQRIKTIENSKHTFLDLLKSVVDEQFRENEGREMELVRISGERELQRLAKLHKYADGSVDQPILSAETLEMLEKDDDTEPEGRENVADRRTKGKVRGKTKDNGEGNG
jgi:hypothetical protein